MRFSFSLLSFIFLISAVLLAYANALVIDFDYLLGHVQIHLMILMLIVFAAGSTLTAFYYSTRLLKAKRAYRQLEYDLQCSQLEVKKLRYSPLKDKSL